MLDPPGRQPRHAPRHSRPRDGFARAVLLDDAGWLPRSARVVSRTVALLLAIAVGALLVSLVAGSPVPGISDQLPWRAHQPSRAAQPHVETSTPRQPATSSAATTPGRDAPDRSPSASASGHPQRTEAPRTTPARTSAAAGNSAGSTRPAASPPAAPTTRPGNGRTHANTTHPRPTKTHHP